MILIDIIASLGEGENNPPAKRIPAVVIKNARLYFLESGGLSNIEYIFNKE